MMRTMATSEIEHHLPIIISLLAFAISGINVYLTLLRSAELTIVAGEYLNVHHFVPAGNLAMSLPITIANSGARVATVRRLALLVSGGWRDRRVHA